jgi:D-alanyl-D-alanine carboxypeptidase (penicillin-binding protein 5/6)
MRRARAAILIAFAFAWPGAAPGHAAPDAFPGSARAYLVRVDGVTVWAASAYARLAPASLTKLMTALLVAETTPDDAMVKVSANASRAIGARMGLAAGVRIAAGELMAGMLLRSANDACLALAEHVAGSEHVFVARMNARARSLGLTATRFANACGFDAAGHHSSANDLATMAELVLADAKLASLVAQPGYVARAANGRTYALANTNAPIGRVRGAAGVKTGHTGRAGHCLVGLVERDGVRVLVVLLGARDRWWDAVAMVEQAFDRARAMSSSQALRR